MKRALLVGINDYRAISDLRGCINDVLNMRNILKTYLGFTNEDIRVLTDYRATKDNIIHRLEWMVAESKPGDYFIFYFAGHGSQIRDRDGDELRDHMDELICPWDMNWDNKFIIDDDLNNIFKQLASGVTLEVFLDCCHSGSGLRGLNAQSDRFLPPPADVRCRYEGEENKLKHKKSFRSLNNSTSGHVLWAACKDGQTSADAYIDGTYNGAFTYYWCKHFEASKGRISRKKLLQQVRKSIKWGDYSQVPQLEFNVLNYKDGGKYGKG